MFRNTSAKKFMILTVALLLVATLVLTACSEQPFKAVEIPQSGSVEGNGGIAVTYGEWLYYINGYTSDVNATNSYTNDVVDAPRVGSVVRIKLADLAGMFAIQDDANKTSSEKTKDIEQYVRDHAQTVVPNIYYSGNTTTTQFNGLYIFGDRIYILTPNDQLTAGGDSLTSQLVLMSYDLGGGDAKRHFVFTNNSAQIWFSESQGKVVATYLMDSLLYKLDVQSGTSTQVTTNGTNEAEDVADVYNSVNWDVAGKCLFFIDKYYAICKLSVGSDKYDVVVPNDTYEVHEHDGEKQIEAGNISYTIQSVNNGQVYYTIADSENSSISGTVLYYAKQAVTNNNHTVALYNSSLSGLKAWKDGKAVFTKSIVDDVVGTFYGIYVTQDADGSTKPLTLLDPAYNDSSITIDRIEGDTLYYTADSISYTLDLNNTTEQQSGKPYAKSLASATGWAQPDFATYDSVSYIITATSTGGLTIVKFDPDTIKKSSPTPISLQLLAKAEEEE